MCWNTYTHRKIYPLHNPDTNRQDFFLLTYMNKTSNTRRNGSIELRAMIL